MWRRAARRNETNKQMDVKKSNFLKEERAQKKEAKKTAKSMQKNEGDYKGIVNGWGATDGVTSSQMSKYERGLITNKKGAKFCSKEAVEKYRKGHETDSSSN